MRKAHSAEMLNVGSDVLFSLLAALMGECKKPSLEKRSIY